MNIISALRREELMQLTLLDSMTPHPASNVVSIYQPLVDRCMNNHNGKKGIREGKRRSSQLLIISTPKS